MRQKRVWVHPYLEQHFFTRLFVGTLELQESDLKFSALNRMPTDLYVTLVYIDNN